MDWKRSPAIKAACNKCRKIGHWEKMCKTKKIRRGQRPIFLGTICELLKNSKEFALRAFVKEFAKQIDTGQIDPDADVTCISANSIPNSIPS